MQELCLKGGYRKKTGKRVKKLEIKASRQDGGSARPDGQQSEKPWNMAWRQDGKAGVLTCTKMAPVRKTVRTPFLTIRGMKKRKIAYASGRASCRPDLHKKSTVRKAVLTPFLTIRGLENGHFAYAS